ncbi:MAG: hypothetical protein MR543_09225 [Robinsoniella sp.]|nr:hypothetical protein [Robinsoniella sp.]
MNVLRVVMNSMQMGELNEDVDVVSYETFMASPEYDSLRSTQRANSPVMGEDGLIDYVQTEKSQVE